MARVLPFILLLGFLIFCLLDCAQMPKPRVRLLPKWAWLVVIVLFPLVGGVAWLTLGRTWGGSGTNGSSGGTGGRRGGPPRAPDDDDDFLRGLN